MTSQKRVLVAMSGGVDSSVAAALLKDAGHEVIGMTMKTFCYSDTHASPKTCCGLEGIADARRVADALEIPHYVVDVEDEFTRDVIDDFVTEYATGRTPNPCVRCNSTTKIPDLLERGRQLGCETIATGHYVWIDHAAEHGPSLHRGRDIDKDQSYFLWAVPRGMLPHLNFPLGDLTKREVRARARELELVTADKPESQEICFVPTGNYRDLLRTRLDHSHPALEAGTIVLESGEIVGHHKGYAGFTVGQRKGLGGGFPDPMYVVEVRAETREVVVGPSSSCYAATMVVDELNWLQAPAVSGDRLNVQIRYRAEGVEAVVTDLTDDRISLRFASPQRAVTPGQSAVMFDGTKVLGGGRIVSAGGRPS